MEENERPIGKPEIWAKQCFFLTKIALAIGLLESLAIILGICVPNKLSESFGLFSIAGFLFLVPILAICFGGGVITLISLLVTKNRSKTPYLHCFSSIVLGGVIPLMLMLLTVHITNLNRQRSLLLICRENLMSLCTSVQSYKDAKDTQNLPIDTWSDEFDFLGDTFFCPADSDNTNGSSYAMNENIVELTALPDNIVLFFESDLGWNGRGGLDDVVTDRHKRHGKPGANIAFADGHVEFVEADKIPTLRWTIEQKRGAEATR